MTKRMLIDASHAEETRVAVLDGSRLEEFDLEFANKLPLKGNIYLAKVVRVEPSLQAAFVEYGGNRHGFLAFGEIHPDYYQIPVADREKLLAMQEAEAREAAEEEERAAARAAARARKLALAEQRRRAEAAADSAAAEAETASPEAETAPAEGMEGSGQSMPAEGSEGSDQTAPAAATAEEVAAPPAGATDEEAAPALAEPAPAPAEPAPPQPAAEAALSPEAAPPAAEDVSPAAEPAAPAEEMEAQSHIVSVDQEMPPPETLGGAGAELSAGEEEGLLAGDGAAEEETSDAEFGAVEEDEEDLAEERIGRRVPPRFLRNYKIQEVIKRRQIMLVQVVKEERGGKGAALTTYISLAGRFSVLMPNTPRGGGVSRKITSLADRRRLREVIDELDLPPGMSLIIRTAGAQRPKAEIRRDCEALLRLWDSIRERTLASVAPALIYQEADLIKRAIRDGYARDVDEILVEGEEAYNQVRDVMRMLMPEAVRKVQLYRDGPMPLFARYGVEQQLEAMHNQVVPLKSGGTIVIHQTEALVAIDVNSGRSTRERNIEDTALRTNLEAAEEIARQLRLRDLAGLIVIDFIDMESPKNNAAVEKRLKEALKNDRARIQVGRISHFGLLEMSRQRLRPSLMEQTFQTCPHCQGRGVVRSPESAAIQVLRALEEEGAKRRAAEVLVHVRPEVAMYLLNRKRDRLNQIEERFGMLMQFSVAEALPPHLTHKLERLRAADQRPAQEERSQPPAIRIDTLALPPPTEAEEDEAAEAAGEPGESEAAPLAGAQAEGQERRRRRRRRRRRSTEASAPPAQAGEGPGAAETATEAAGEASAPIAQPAAGEEEGEEEPTAAGEAPIATEEGQERPRRRRGRRGGRRRREGSTLEPMAGQAGAAAAEAASGAMPFYAGPTPADPFAADIDPVIAAMEAAERAAEEAAARSARSSSGPSGEAAAPALPQPSRAEPAAEPPPSPAPVDAAPAEVAAAGPAPAAGQAVGGSAESPPAPEAAPAAVAASPPPPEPADSGPVVGPPVQPVLVDALTDVPRKRGWWRR